MVDVWELYDVRGQLFWLLFALGEHGECLNVGVKKLLSVLLRRKG